MESSGFLVTLTTLRASDGHTGGFERPAAAALDGGAPPPHRGGGAESRAGLRPGPAAAEYPPSTHWTPPALVYHHPRVPLDLRGDRGKNTRWKRPGRPKPGRGCSRSPGAGCQKGDSGRKARAPACASPVAIAARWFEELLVGRSGWEKAEGFVF